MAAFDCFLPHNSQDKPAVRELKRRLTAAGLRCWLGKSSLLLVLQRRYAKDPTVDSHYRHIGLASIESRRAGTLGLPEDTPGQLP